MQMGGGGGGGGGAPPPPFPACHCIQCYAVFLASTAFNMIRFILLVTSENIFKIFFLYKDQIRESEAFVGRLVIPQEISSFIPMFTRG